MYSEVLSLMLLAAAGGVGQVQGGSWLSARAAAQNLRVYNSLVSTTAIEAAVTSRGGHPPLTDQPLQQARQTRLQLSIFTPRTEALQLSASAAAALSSAWVRLVLRRRQPSLAPGPSIPAPREPLDTPQPQPPEAVGGPSATTGLGALDDARGDQPTFNESQPATSAWPEAEAGSLAGDGPDAAAAVAGYGDLGDAFSEKAQQQATTEVAYEAAAGGAVVTAARGSAVDLATAEPAGADAVATMEAAAAVEANVALLEADAVLQQTASSGIQRWVREARLPADAAAAAEPRVVVLDGSGHVGAGSLRTDAAAAAKQVKAGMKAEVPADVAVKAAKAKEEVEPPEPAEADFTWAAAFGWWLEWSAWMRQELAPRSHIVQLLWRDNLSMAVTDTAAAFGWWPAWSAGMGPGLSSPLNIAHLPRRDTMSMGFAATAAILAVTQLLAARAARRQAAALREALDRAQEEHAGTKAQLRSQQEVMVSKLLGSGSRDHVAEAEAEQQRRRAMARTAAAVRVAVQLTAKASELQRSQEELMRALTAAVRAWRGRSEALVVALGRCRRGAERVARSAAAERRRLQAESERAAAEAAERHARDLAELRAWMEEELTDEQRRHAATAAAAQLHHGQHNAALREMRRRHCRSVTAWMALRSWLGLQVEVLSARADKLASEQSKVLAEAGSLVEQHRVRAATAQQQLVEQVAVVVETRRINCELEHQLAHNNSAIMELEGELAVAKNAVQSQRQRLNVLQELLTTNEELLSASRSEVAELEERLREAQAAVETSEARAEQLAKANELLEQQVAQFVQTAKMIAELEESHLGPTRAHAAALEEKMSEERELAATAIIERESKLSEAADQLAAARREAEAAQRARGEMARRLEECEREMKAAQSELSRREEESFEPGVLAFVPSKQSPLRDQYPHSHSQHQHQQRDHHRDQRGRDQEAALQLQQLLGPLTSMTLPLPPDAKALLNGVAASPASAAGALTPFGDRGVAGSSGSAARSGLRK